MKSLGYDWKRLQKAGLCQSSKQAYNKSNNLNQLDIQDKITRYLNMPFGFEISNTDYLFIIRLTEKVENETNCSSGYYIDP